MEIQNSKMIKEASKGKSPFLKLEQGKNKLRIISKIHGVKEHLIKIGENQRMIACPRAMEEWEAAEQEKAIDRSIKCPVCESGNRNVRTQFLAIAINEKGEIGVLKKGTTIFSPIADLKEEGYDLAKTYVVISRKGEALDTEYTVIPSKEEKELTPEEQDGVLAFTADFNLEQRTKPMSYDNIVRKLKGEDPVFNDGDNEQ